MIYHQIAIGNDYLGTMNRLSGCIKDSNTLARRFGPVSAESKVLNEIGIDEFVAELARLKGICRAGSEHVAIISFSGHGTQMPAQLGNEADGLDEGLCFVRNRRIEVIWDNQLTTLLAGMQALFIADCCHSETMLRGAVTFVVDTNGAEESEPVAPRSIDFATITEGMAGCEIASIIEPSRKHAATARALRGEDGAIPGISFIAGCGDKESSFDTPQGGMLTLALDATVPQLPEGSRIPDWCSLAFPRVVAQSNKAQNPALVGLDVDLRMYVPGKAKPTPQPPSVPVASASTGPAFIQMLDGSIWDCTKRNAN